MVVARTPVALGTPPPLGVCAYGSSHGTAARITRVVVCDADAVSVSSSASTASWSPVFSIPPSSPIIFSPRSFSTALHNSMSSRSTRAVLVSGESLTPPSRRLCSTSSAFERRPCTTSHLGLSGSTKTPRSMTIAGNAGASTIQRQFCETFRNNQSTSALVTMPRHSISSYVTTSAPLVSGNAISPTYAGTHTAEAPIPRPTTNLPKDRPGALLETAMTSGPTRKNIPIPAIAFFLPNSTINAPPTKVPKTAPSFAIPTTISLELVVKCNRTSWSM